MLARLRESLSRWQTASLFFLSSLWVVLAERHLWDSWYYVPFPNLVYGTAPRPYVMRSFMPFLIRTIKSLMPPSVEGTLTSFVEQHPFLAASHGWEPLKLERAIFLILNIAAFIFAAYGIRRLMRLSNLSDRWSLVATVITICSIPAYLLYATYIYDGPAIALFTWCLVFLTRESWLMYVLTFTICVWNKETGVLLTLIFGLVYWQQIRCGNRSKLLLIGLQVLIAVAIALLKSNAFAANPGGAVEWHLADRKTILFLYSIQTYVTVLVLLFLLTYRIRSQQIVLRRGIIVLPVLIGLAFFFGILDEYRAYFEALPIVATMISVTVFRLACTLGIIENSDRDGLSPKTATP